MSETASKAVPLDGDPKPLGATNECAPARAQVKHLFGIPFRGHTILGRTGIQPPTDVAASEVVS